ncbi:MAG: glycosyltransferase [Gallionella sp.]|nr:glycosyltransferase [Gallionella sp.]
MADPNFYRAFQDRYRGSRELTKSRLSVYLPFILPLQQLFGVCHSTDLGCGQGEWLELMRDNGLDVQGVDFDPVMLEAARARGLDVRYGDAIQYLQALPAGSQMLVTAFHVAEHLPFDVLQSLVAEALRVLKPGGLLILETPNPENIVVGTANFYMDPTHQRPIPSLLLSYLAEYCGFERIKTLRLQETVGPSELGDLNLLNVFNGVSYDYAIAAQKGGDTEALAATAGAFDLNYGLSLDNLATFYDRQIKSTIQQADAHAQQAGAHAQHAGAQAQQAGAQAQQAEAQARQAEAQAQQAEAEARRAMNKVDELGESYRLWQAEADRVNRELQNVYASRSWRITAPIRQAMRPCKLVVRKTRSIIANTKNLSQKTLRNRLLRVLWNLRALPVVKSFERYCAMHCPAVNAHLRKFVRVYLYGQLHKVPVFKSAYCQPLPSQEFAYPDIGGSVLHHWLPAGKRIIYYYVDHTIGCPVNTGMQRVVRGLSRALLGGGEQLCFVKWNFEYRQLVLVNRDELAYLARWHGPEIKAEEVARYPEAGSPEVSISNHPAGEANWLVIPEVTYINNHPSSVTLDIIMAAKRHGLKSAFVFYDATPLRRKELADVAPMHEAYMQQLLLADLIAPISEWSASDLAGFFTHHQLASSSTLPKIVPIPLTGESQLSPRVMAAGQATRKLILSVGSITSHKNQLSLVKAFIAFTVRNPGCGWELTLVGNIHPDIACELLALMSHTPAISVLDNLPDEELERLLNQCAFTVFPSVMEGFGLPILESLWHGKPCICANFGAMSEVAAGGGCLMVDVRSSDTIALAIERLIFEPETLARLQAEAVARPLTVWQDYADDFCGALNQVSDPLHNMGTVYYLVDHTCAYHANSGIQRVVRGMARALIESGVSLVPVKWDRAAQDLIRPSGEELVNMSRWNGPPVNGWAPWQTPEKASLSDWLFIPELLSDPAGLSNTAIKRYAAERRLRTVGIFYDAIPWKMTNLYTSGESERHGEYMRGLNEFELVLSISEFSRNDLVRFLRSVSDRTPNLEDRVRACVLPGEFRESERILQIRPAREDSPTRILCVCTIEPRKNHFVLLEAYKQLADKCDKQVELCLVGGSPFPELAAQVQHYIDTVPGIRWERHADDTRLRELYDECDFTVYPSLEEGFGLPILESIWHARPCICRDSGAMAEVAEGGGCLMVETANADILAAAMMQLTIDTGLRQRLALEAVERPIRTWSDYARDAVLMMANERQLPVAQKLPPVQPVTLFRQEAINLSAQPLLSICISTYNRAAWLGLSLQNLERLIPVALDEVEIVVCDNTSTDNTPEVVKPYMGRSDFRYYRNPANVGMLGNLQVTAHHARGRHVWILGDDDLLKPGSIERILQVLRTQPDLALVYLNYAYTREDDAAAVKDLDKFLLQSTPVVAPGQDIFAPVWRISTESENFFTAIYCVVFRRDHALHAYSQNTDGRPFSTMLTCIPTTNHVLHHMMDEPACWIGEPQLVVNMNVSWLKYASIWILERLPEAFDLTEKMGADQAALDACRIRHLPHVRHWFNEIYQNDTESNIDYFSPVRLVSRFKHLKEFRSDMQYLRSVYEAARSRGAKGTDAPTAEVFPTFQNTQELS